MKKFPQWLQLQPESEPIANCEDGLTTGSSDAEVELNMDDSLDHVAAGLLDYYQDYYIRIYYQDLIIRIIKVLLEITDCSVSTNETVTQPDIFPLEQLGRKLNENIHPCWPMYSGRIVNI
jgi:hypothetical protein